MNKKGKPGALKAGNPAIKSGIIVSVVTFLITLQFVLLALMQYRSIKATREVLSTLKKFKNDFLGDQDYGRVVFTGGKFYFNVHVPGFPSKILIKNHLGELNRIRPVKSTSNRLRIMFLSITNKCPLRCRHCYEWESLNKPGLLAIEDFKTILAKFTDQGVGQVHFGGGEPMLNYPCLLELTKFLKGKSETWIATSGLGLSLEKARALRKAGLTGAAISVDHFDEEKHNDFRGSDKSFGWAMEATENSLNAGLVTCWSICLSREFTSAENLDRYASFAASRGVHFIQFFDPMPVGRYKGQDILLTKEQLALVEDFYLMYNHAKNIGRMPLVTYVGYNHRRLGCLGRGNRYIYIDANGNLQLCPFCRNGSGIKIIDQCAHDLLHSLSMESCGIHGIYDRS